MLSHFTVCDINLSSEKSIIQHKASLVSFSLNTQAWKVDALNERERTELELNNQGPFRSPGKWNISSVNNETNDKARLANVTRTLVLDEKSKMVNNGEYYIYNLIII